MSLPEVPVVLFRLVHDGSQDGFFSRSPRLTEHGLFARDPTAPQTPQMLAYYLERWHVQTCWISFATWKSTKNRLRKWFNLPENKRPQNIRLHAIYVPLLSQVRTIHNAFQLAQWAELIPQDYMEDEYLIFGTVDMNAFIIADMPVTRNSKLAFLPIEYRHPFDIYGTYEPGVLADLPENLVPGGAKGCYKTWRAMLEHRGQYAESILDALLSAFTAEAPKVVCDIRPNRRLAPLSQRALELLA